MIELKDFITESLKQMIIGVEEAQKFAKEHNSKINPKDIFFQHGMDARVSSVEQSQKIQMIDFDVAVTTGENAGKEGGIGIFASPIQIGIKGHSGEEISNVSRLKFSIPLLLPVQDPEKKYNNPHIKENPWNSM